MALYSTLIYTYGSEISSDEISWNFIDEISMKFHWNFIVFEMIMKFHRSLFFMIPLTFNYFSVCGPPICQHYSILSLILVCIDRHNLPQLKDIQVIWLQESLKSSNYPTLYLFLLLLCFRFSSSLCSQQDRKTWQLKLQNLWKTTTRLCNPHLQDMPAVGNPKIYLQVYGLKLKLVNLTLTQNKWNYYNRVLLAIHGTFQWNFIVKFHEISWNYMKFHRSNPDVLNFRSIPSTRCIRRSIDW